MTMLPDVQYVHVTSWLYFFKWLIKAEIKNYGRYLHFEVLGMWFFIHQSRNLHIHIYIFTYLHPNRQIWSLNLKRKSQKDPSWHQVLNFSVNTYLIYYPQVVAPLNFQLIRIAYQRKPHSHFKNFIFYAILLDICHAKILSTPSLLPLPLHVL